MGLKFEAEGLKKIFIILKIGNLKVCTVAVIVSVAVKSKKLKLHYEAGASSKQEILQEANTVISVVVVF